MKNDPIWRAFAQSGDPLYYLLYKAVNMGSREGENDDSGPLE